MITYVNTVLVANNSGVVSSISRANKGKIVFWDIDNNRASLGADTDRFKVGVITGKTIKQLNPSTHAMDSVPEVKWSNIIKVDDIKNIEYHTNAGSTTEDTVTIDFSNVDQYLLREFAEGGKRIIVRLTFKDLPTRFRKWTESYEYITEEADILDDENNAKKNAYIQKICTDIANMINKEYKRARVTASVVNNNKIQLVAMQYDDNESVDTINWYEKIRFNANMYYTDPAAEGWESLNKHFVKGVSIDKVPGKTDPAHAKLVRDREANSMGYLGILNRGEGTWPVIKPAMMTDLTKTYNSVTIEFENMYRAADDIFRKTKQTVEIYTVDPTSTIKTELDKL